MAEETFKYISKFFIKTFVESIFAKKKRRTQNPSKTSLISKEFLCNEKNKQKNAVKFKNPR